MPIKKLKEFRKKQAGVYVISPQPPEDDTIMFKIGRTIQMNKRLNAYHICFVDGFYIYKAIMLNDTYKTKTLIDKKKTLNKTIEIEKFIHDKLEQFRHTSSTRRKHEWFSFTGELNEINEVLIACHNEFKSDTDYPITTFSKKGFYDYFYVDEIEEMKITEQKLNIVNKPPSYIGGQVKDKKDGVRRSGRQTKLPSKFKDSVYFDLKKKTTKSWS